MNRVYLGVDIGTTNTKVLILGENGEVTNIHRMSSPREIVNGVEYLKIDRIEGFVRECMRTASQSGKVEGIAFSSIGESVVPVSDGKALSNPVMWHDRSSYELWSEAEPVTSRIAPYSKTGVNSNYTFSIHKIRWLKERLSRVPQYWLPVSSYLAYALCGVPSWDFSQACRSFAIDIHARNWNKEILGLAGESGESMGKLLYTGEFIGKTPEGIPVYSAGHDHITGLFAVSLFSDTPEFLFDSMGSSTVVAAVVTEKTNEMHMGEPFMIGGTLGVAFGDRQYYLESNMRHYGRVLQWIMNTTGKEATPENFLRLNEIIENFADIPARPLFMVNGDLVLRERTEGINILEAPLDMSPERLLQAGYVYLTASSKLIIDNLEKFNGRSLPVMAGGGGTMNDTLMKYKASILNREIKVLTVNEVTALGAALAAVVGRKDFDIVKNLKENLPVKSVEPDRELGEKLRTTVAEIWNKYERIAAISK